MICVGIPICSSINTSFEEVAGVEGNFNLLLDLRKPRLEAFHQELI